MNTETQANQGFQRRLGLFDSTMLVVGSMIGSGIYIVSASMARFLGSPGWVLIAWILSGVMTVMGALAFGELASMMPKAGGPYVFLKRAYNPLVGFLYGWTLFLVIQTGTIAAVGMAFAKFTGVLVPWFTEENVLFEIFGFKFHAVQLLAILSIVFLTLINLRGIVVGKNVQNFFTVTKAVILLAFIAAGIFLAGGKGAWEMNLSYFWDTFGATDGLGGSLAGIALAGALSAAMVGSLFSADAWNGITFTGAEVINPRKTLPRSLFLGTLIVSVIYILCNVAYLNVLPLRGDPQADSDFARGIQYAAQDRVGIAAMQEIIGGGGAAVMAVFIMFSTFGCNNGLILAGARVYYAMAGDNMFLKKAARLNAKGVPASALVFQCIWSCLLCLSGTYSDLLDYVVFAVLMFYVLTISGIFILRYKYPEEERPYKAFGYPAMPILYILCALAIMLLLLIYKPIYTWPGLIIVIIGIPVYWLRQRAVIKH
jgi:APA family basic amino acid/polyamine antiporter